MEGTEAVKRTYSKVRYAAQFYTITTKVTATMQEDWSITEYSNLLKGFCQEMNHY